MIELKTVSLLSVAVVLVTAGVARGTDSEAEELARRLNQLADSNKR